MIPHFDLFGCLVPERDEKTLKPSKTLFAALFSIVRPLLPPQLVTPKCYAFLKTIGQKIYHANCLWKLPKGNLWSHHLMNCNAKKQNWLMISLKPYLLTEVSKSKILKEQLRLLQNLPGKQGKF